MRRNSRKLHLGCFDQKLEGWVNTDITPHLFVARLPGFASLMFRLGLLPRRRYEQHKQGVFQGVDYLDVTKPFPFAAGSFDYAYCSHMLEHLRHEDAAFCIREVHRVLAPDGIFRVAVPDLDALVANYDPQCADVFVNAVFETGQRADKNRHWWLYNEISLTRLMKDAGFRTVYRCQFRTGRCSDVTLIDNRPESLFVEAVK